MSTILDFEKLMAEMMSLYNADNYAGAYDLLLREEGRFPEFTDELYYQKMCMVSRMNDIPQALQYFREALAQGYWFAPRWLREDEDLKLLQGLPEFEEMFAACQQKLAEAQAAARPEVTVLQPEEQPPASGYPLLIALHGNGANAPRTLNPHRGIVSQGWLVAVLQSSQVAGPGSFVWDDYEKAQGEIQQHLAALEQDYAIDPRRIVVSGFSMGGGLATWLGLNGAIKARGFVALGPYLPDVDALQPFLNSAKSASARGYIVVGEEDNVCLGISHKVHDLLKANGIPCELELLPGLGHEYPDDYTNSLEKGLAFVLQE